MSDDHDDAASHISLQLLIPIESGTLVFCAKTGAASLLSGRDHQLLADALCRLPYTFDSSILPEPMLAELIRGGILVPEDHDEVMDIRKGYLDAKENSPLVMTITTTMDCNLGCYYCYEDRSTDRLEQVDVFRLVKHVRGTSSRVSLLRSILIGMVASHS